MSSVERKRELARAREIEEQKRQQAEYERSRACLGELIDAASISAELAYILKRLCEEAGIDIWANVGEKKNETP